MAEKMYGPRTVECPSHGEQPVVGIGPRSIHLACGAYQGEGVRWWHPGDVTVEQFEAARLRVEEIYGLDSDDDADDCCDGVHLCQWCDSYGRTTQAERDEASGLVELINAYIHMKEGS